MERSEVAEKYKWKVEDLFSSDEEWEKTLEEIQNKVNFSKYAGKLGDKNTLLEFYQVDDEFGMVFERLAVYASMRSDEDARVEKYNIYDAKISSLYAKYAAEISFFDAEMASQDESYLQALMQDKDFAPYSYQIKKLIQLKPHVLNKNEQKIVAMASETFQTFRDTFGFINNVELPLPEIEFNGSKTKLTFGLYSMALHSSDRALREDAYNKLYGAFDKVINTVTSTYFGNVKKDVFLSKVYKYNSCLEMALANEDVDKKVYENLLNFVGKNLPTMHRYIADRKKIMGYDKLYFYDIYAPLVDNISFALPYDDAYDYIVKGLAPLGEEYQALLKKGHDERWIDVEETTAKRSGAYSTGCYNVHPYVLLNYQPNINDVFTIAHEMGHSLHTYFSNANQPYAKASYKIFVAEVASTVNEVLLLKYMLKEAKDDIQMQKYLLNYYLDSMRATLHRQTMFAEFEYIAHSKVEKGEPLTKDGLNAVYAELGKKYYGDAIEHDYNISTEWSRIPHFYTAFYVYKYSTGIISAINIANKILTEGESAVKNYFKFLSGGSSTDPVALLKLAGVDLTTEEPFVYAMKEFENTLNEFEKLMGI